jgi:hypothetical protein
MQISFAKDADLTHNSLYSENTCVSGERHLWLQVIMQAIQDAARIPVLEQMLGNPLNKPQRLSSIQAELFEAQRSLSWLTTRSEDLTEVCCLAGIDVNALLDRRDKFKAGKFAVSSSELLLLASSFDA